MLDVHVFRNLAEVCKHLERWLVDYNREISHKSRSGLTPATFRIQNDFSDGEQPSSLKSIELGACSCAGLLLQQATAVRNDTKATGLVHQAV